VILVLLTDEVKKFLKDRFDSEYNCTVGVLSSMRNDGTPNAAPKHFRIRDDEHLEFTDVFSQTLGEVLKKTPQVTVVFFDAKAVIGYRVRGDAVLETFGPLFQQAANQLESIGFKPKAVVSVKVSELQFLQYGPNTGNKIG
jgi:predicted pyridoxine 5'-phosphate oxidase superfamily flavin-nucleotide-binding protein